MAIKGFIGGAGGAYTGGAAGVSNFNYWLTGRYDNVPNGGTAIYRKGGAYDVSGDTVAIYYIKESTGGTFNVETSSDGGGTWSAATGGTGLSANNGTTIGAAFTAAISETNAPTYRVRVTGASGNGVKIIGWGVYYNGAHGGAILCDTLLNQSGHNLDEEVVTPTAIINPIITSVDPDLIISRMADYSYEWANGGNYDLMYDKFKAVLPNCDFVTISQTLANPSVDPTNDRAAANITMRQWAITNNETYVDCTSFMGDTFAEAEARGYVVTPGDTSGHPTQSGQWMTSFVLWDYLLLGHIPMGRTAFFGDNQAVSRGSLADYALSARINSKVWMEAPENTLRIYEMRVRTGTTTNETTSSANDFGYLGSGTAGEAFARFGNSSTIRFKTGVGGGITAPSDGGANCGFTGFRFAGYFTTMNINGDLTIDKTVTAAGTTAAQTINKNSGRINFAAGDTSKLVTNSRVTANSIIIATVATNDTTMKSVSAVAAAGSFTLHADAAPTAETAVNFLITN